MAVLGLVVTALVSYLLGSLNFGIIISTTQSKGDIRNYGSGNAGMTNILRIYGKGMAALVAIGDLLKGTIAILLARYVFMGLFQITFFDPGYVAGLFVLLGHIFPLYFHFKGGKGVLTALGVLLVLNPFAFFVLLLINLPIIFKTRIVSLGSILGAILFPILTLIQRLIQHQSWKIEFLFALLIGGIVLYMHRENIVRLKNGTENRFEPKNK